MRKRLNDTEVETSRKLRKLRKQKTDKPIELEHDLHGNIVAYVGSPDIGALAITSRSLQESVEKLKLGPYVKRCRLEQGPPGPIEGCEHLLENIVGCIRWELNVQHENNMLHMLYTLLTP